MKIFLFTCNRWVKINVCDFIDLDLDPDTINTDPITGGSTPYARHRVLPLSVLTSQKETQELKTIRDNGKYVLYYTSVEDPPLDIKRIRIRTFTKT